MLTRAAFAALLAILPPVAAQARPILHPTRDVVVQYRVTGPHGPTDSVQVTIHYAAEGRRMRIQPEGRPNYMIVDRIADHVDLVMPAQHIYIDVPYKPQMMLNYVDKNASFTPHGSATIAGLRCTIYDVQSHDRSGRICLTDDGVMLRAQGQDPRHAGRLEAVNVSYAPQPASLFVPPPGFRELQGR